MEPLGAFDILERILDDAQAHAIGPVPPVAFGGEDAAGTGPVGQALVAVNAAVVLDDRAPVR